MDGCCSLLCRPEGVLLAFTANHLGLVHKSTLDYVEAERYFALAMTIGVSSPCWPTCVSVPWNMAEHDEIDHGRPRSIVIDQCTFTVRRELAVPSL